MTSTGRDKEREEGLDVTGLGSTLDMTRADGITARLAAGRNGILTSADLRAQDLSTSQIKSLLGSGTLVRVRQGVYRHAAVAVSRQVTLAAAELFGLDCPFARRPEVTVLGTGRPRDRRIRVFRTNALDPDDRTIVKGVPTTSMARTLLDLGGVLRYEQVEQATQDAIIQRRVVLADLFDVLERVGGRGRRGCATLRAIIRSSVPDDRLESLLEQRLLEVIHEAHLPPPVLQHQFVCADGRAVRLDFAWPDRRLAIEADGHRWHATTPQLSRDLARMRSLQTTGWRRYGFGWHDVHRDPARTRLELCRIWSTTSP